MGKAKMPIAFVFGIPPAYEIMANFSGLHMDMWGEMEMVGTIMNQDIEMVLARPSTSRFQRRPKLWSKGMCISRKNFPSAR